MEMERVMLSQLTAKSRRVKVCVRVMHKWSYHGLNPDGPAIYVGLVFADQQGGAMYAQIPGPEVPTKSLLFEVDGIYTVTKFNVRPAKSSYLLFDARLMIMVTSFTEAIPSNEPPQSFPQYIYRITHFHDISTTPEALSKYIDIIGVLTHMAKPKTVHLSHKERTATLREITIRDLRERELTVTLWAENVTAFKLPETSADETQKSIVVLFVGCLPRRIYGKVQANAGTASRWYFNPQIEEAQPYYTRLATHPVQVIEEVPDAPSSEVKITPKVLQEKKLSELNILDPYEFPVDGCKCTVTITEIPNDNKWWYMGCELCHKKATYDSGRYYCSDCQHYGARPRYKLTFTAKDDTAEATFFCHDDTARLLVRRSCDYLINPLHPEDSIPQGLVQIISKTFTFVIDLANDSFFTMHQRKYNVKAIVMHPDLQPTIQQPLLLESEVSLKNNPVLTLSKEANKNVSSSSQPAVTAPAPSIATVVGQQSSPSTNLQTDSSGRRQEIDIPTGSTTPPPQPTPIIDQQKHDSQRITGAAQKSSAQRSLFQPETADEKTEKSTGVFDRQSEHSSKRAKITATTQAKTKGAQKAQSAVESSLKEP